MHALYSVIVSRCHRSAGKVVLGDLEIPKGLEGVAAADFIEILVLENDPNIPALAAARSAGRGWGSVRNSRRVIIRQKRCPRI